MKKIEFPLIPLFILCFGLVLHRPLEEFFTSFIVNPILSKIEFQDTPGVGLAFGLICIGAFVLMARRIHNGYQYSLNWVYWSLISSAVYTYYRNSEQVWSFHELFSLRELSIKAMDVLYILALFFLVICIIQYVKNKTKDKKPSNILGFQFDEPKCIEPGNDPHERYRFAKTLKEKIKATLPGNSSFAIGIVGKWGNGKTTFIETIKSSFNNDPKIIPIYFDPWLVPGVGNITEAFFKEFNTTLSRYVDNIGSDLRAYVRLIARDKKQALPLTIAEYINPSANWSMSGVEELKNKISSSLKQLNRKVVVYMDDLDRLDKNEIMEALRLIRNSADFTNVFFIVAFDRDQVEKAIEGFFPLGYDKYLEKIFQIEFYLTPLRRNTLLTEFISGLKEILDEKDKEVLDKMFEQEIGFGNMGYEWLQNYFNHHRDVVRYLNQFSLHYDFVKKEVFLPDFIILILVKLKSSRVYHKFYENQREYLTTDGNTLAIGRKGILSLRYDEDNKTSLETVFLRELKKTLGENGMQENEKCAYNLIYRLFNNQSRVGNVVWNATYESNLPKSHLSAVIPQFFNRYFDYSITGRLSDVEFDEALSGLSKADFLTKMNSWLQDKDTGDDAISSLERIEDYNNNKVVFDKVITALILAGNLELPDQQRRKYYVNGETFLDRFDLNRNKTRKALSKIFNRQEDINLYFNEMLNKNQIPHTWFYAIMNKQSQEKHHSIPFPIDEIKKYIRKTVDLHFSGNPKVDPKLIHILLDRIRCSSTADEKNDFLVKVRAYFMTYLPDSLKLFIGPCQRHFDEGNYRIYSDWVEAFFGSNDQFIADIENYNPNYGSELRKFQQAIIDNPEHPECTKFDFKSLPIDPITKEIS